MSWERRIRPWSRGGCRKETTDSLACGQSPGPCDPAYSVTGLAKSSELGEQSASEQQLQHNHSRTSSLARSSIRLPIKVWSLSMRAGIDTAFHLSECVNPQTPRRGSGTHNAE